MPTYITQGRYTREAIKGMIVKPEDRYEALSRHVARAGGRVMVCGTSALRTLETVADSTGLLWPQQGFTQLTISPGHQFRCCDAFLTNLHRPMSSELVLTAAFAGRELLLETYRHQVIPRGYQFYEFGDSMVII